MFSARIYLDLSEDTRTLLSDLNWDCKGYLLAEVGDVELVDLKVAVALAAARSAPITSPLKGLEIFSLTPSETPAHLLGLSLVLTDRFQPLLDLIASYLPLEGDASDLVHFNTSKRIDVTDIPTDVNLEIPVQLLEAFDTELEFDRLVVETADEIFYYSL